MDINLDSLNQEQKEAVTHGEGPLLIVAGAGTGKTTVVTQRINWLIREKHLQPEEILALTFTEKAAGEMEERVDRALPYGYVDLWISTFHAFGERILKQHALNIGLSYDFKLLNETQGWLLIKKNLAKFELDYYRPLGNPTKFIHALLNHFSRCKDEEVYPEDYLKYAEELKMDLDSMESTGGKGRSKQASENERDNNAMEIARLNELANAYHTYQQLLLDNNFLDFGDLINYTLKLFKQRPQILKHYQQQFKYILIDEFQDTNWAQYELIKLLAAVPHNITVVGDDDQSIYKFRGASVSNILNFKKDYPKAREIFLQTNYRSAQNILDLSYKFIQLNNPERLEIKLATKDKTLSKQLKAVTDQTGVIEYNFLPSIDEEAAYVVKKIAELKKTDSNLSWNDFAILVRANDSAVDFTGALSVAKIPFQFFASKGLFQKPVILDIVNYLRLLDDYRESPSLFRVLNMPVVQIVPEQLVNLNYWAKRKAWSLYEVLRQISVIPKVTPETVRESGKLVAWIEKHTRLAQEQPVTKVVYDFLEETKYLEYLKTLPEEIAQAEFSYLNQFYRRLKDFAKSFSENKVADWLREFELELAAGESGSLAWEQDQGPEAVRVMTVHAAKGLEFKHVFIPNLVDRRFPTIEHRDPILLPDNLVKEILPEGNVHLQEERRLMYVALTRAREGLYLTGGADYGSLRAKKPSRFIAELGVMQGQQVMGTTKKLISSKTTSVKSSENLPQTYSYSQLKSFQACPLQYRYAYLLKIPVKGKFTFSFGSTIHKTLQKFFELVKQGVSASQGDLFGRSESKSLPNEQDLLRLYDESWIDDWYDSRAQHDEFYAKGKAALREFYHTWSVEKKVPERLEKGFKLLVGKHIIKGVIDRIDRQDGKVEIIDYKTGKSKEKLDWQTKEQLLIYQLASQQAGDKVKQLTYYYIEDGRRLSFLGTEKDLAKIADEVDKVIAQMKTSDFTATPNPAVCQHCDFNKICEFSQAK